MIAHLRGTLLEKTPDYAVVEAGGVGYHLAVTLHTFYDLPEPGGETRLLVYTHMWSEGLALYGFSRADERAMFVRLISVSGIGPRLARNILSGIRAASLSEALRTADVKRIHAIPGVGKKLADRLVLELGARELQAPVGEAGAAPPPADPVLAQVVAALVNLGYKQEVALRALQRLRQEEPQATDLESLLRGALRLLTK